MLCKVYANVMQKVVLLPVTAPWQYACARIFGKYTDRISIKNTCIYVQYVYARIITNTYIYVLHVYVRIFEQIRTYTFKYVQSVSPAGCQYLHVFIGNTFTYGSGQPNIRLLCSQIRAYTCVYVRIRTCTYVIRRVRIQYDLRRMLYVYCTYLHV